MLFLNCLVIFGVKAAVKEFKTKCFKILRGPVDAHVASTRATRWKRRPGCSDRKATTERRSTISSKAWAWDGRACIRSSETSGRCSCASLRRTQRRKALALRRRSSRRRTLRDSLAGFLRHAVETATEEGSAPGCLLVCVAPLVDDAEVRQFLKDAVAGGVALVKRRFCDAISAGEIPSDFPVAARASQVLDLGRGLTMRAQMGTPRKTLLKDAEEAADLVLLPPRGNPER